MKLSRQIILIVSLLALPGELFAPGELVTARFPKRTRKNGTIFPTSYKKKRDGVQIEVHELTHAETQELFGKKFKGRLSGSGLVPIGITIYNEGTVPVRISRKHISLAQVPNKKLSKKFLVPEWVPESASQVFGFYPTLVGTSFMMNGILFLAFGHIAGALFFGTMGYGLATAPRRMGRSGRRKINRKNAEREELWGSAGLESMRIRPGETKSTTIFVRSDDFFPRFSIGLFKEATPQRRIDFAVNL